MHLSRRVSIRFRISRSTSSLSRDKRIRGERPSPFAIATIVSRLGTFLPRSTSPQKFAVMSPRSAALSRLSLAFLLSLRTRLANSEEGRVPVRRARPYPKSWPKARPDRRPLEYSTRQFPAAYGPCSQMSSDNPRPITKANDRGESRDKPPPIGRIFLE